MKYAHLYLSLVLVAVLLIPGGYAYSSDTTSSGEVTSDYFTVILYSDAAIFNGSLSYKVIDGHNTIVPDIYTLISGTHLVIYGDRTYNVSVEAHFYDANGQLDATSYLFIDDTPVNEITLDPNTIYNVQMNVTFSSVQFSGTITCVLTLVVSAVYNDCTYADSGNCAIIEVPYDPMADLIDITTGDDVEGDYIKTTTTVGGVPQVIITNSTNENGQGVADSEGNIHVVLDIPANTPFCIKIWNRDWYNVNANIRVDNIIINGETQSHYYENQRLGIGLARYYCYYRSYGSDTWTTTNLNNVVNNEGWFYSSSGTVTISIDAHYSDFLGNKAQNVRLSIIFKDAQ